MIDQLIDWQTKQQNNGFIVFDTEKHNAEAEWVNQAWL